ncbi:MAG: hypothetical protein K8R49_03475, partial [Candidatus Cloacimonetes bacterium]|nr:hypothetical protein [Candidatus Cloacimonadota bacterium]
MEVVKIFSRSFSVFLFIIGFAAFAAILFADDQSAGSGFTSAKVYETDLDGKIQLKETIQQSQTNYRTQPEQMPG